MFTIIEKRTIVFHLFGVILIAVFLTCSSESYFSDGRVLFTETDGTIGFV